MAATLPSTPARPSAGTVASLGIDAGSTTCKLVAISADGVIIGSAIEPTHPRLEEQAERMTRELLARLSADASGAAAAAAPPPAVVATGYGRKLVRHAGRAVTEITCHARGVFAALATTGTLVDIGGQDTKVIRVGEGGRALDFMMNDKCAAGTGRFLEHTAARLQVPLAELGARALAARDEVAISSTCTVFAESEIISLVAHGTDLEAILRGLHRSLVSRVAAMAHTVGVAPPLLLSGGVAQNAAVRAMLAEALGVELRVPREPQLMGAYGAALAGLA